MNNPVYIYTYDHDEGDELAANLYQLALASIPFADIDLAFTANGGATLRLPSKYVTRDGDWSIYTNDQLRDLIAHAIATYNALRDAQDESAAYDMAQASNLADLGTDAEIAHAYIAWQMGTHHG